MSRCREMSPISSGLDPFAVLVLLPDRQRVVGAQLDQAGRNANGPRLTLRYFGARAVQPLGELVRDRQVERTGDGRQRTAVPDLAEGEEVVDRALEPGPRRDG